ncbi:restriction endonuclease [Listeria monocytogenes]|uniref:restriction endonuclease n=1 Tax=Listeria monocytogenes TaxID=1639 RepID=UPI000397DE6A|nr:restriction endonuclease [Listeria monocytogenes]EAD5387961.1 restriction endonuclease [Listeria monocytogenes serotype 4b]EAF4565775.1 restriction endonuclease [Listeria monocytogenes serotype 1/2a]EAG6378080.1 restriction endonuclease [Listeria monocytogenes CFSAN002355]EAA0034287.1 restriction endonuclease [Listeria monocytogenes]EAA0111947.1 restriction endonuclease [Listeria monocytogenes]
MNKDWTKLKQSANGLPTFDSIIPYILEVLKNDEEATIHTIRNRVYKHLNIPEDIKLVTYPETNDFILANRFSFALSELYKAGALCRPKRGIYQITTSGKQLLKINGDKLTKKMLEEEPDYINYIKELAIRNQRKGISTSVSEDIEKENPKKEVGSIIDNMNNEVSIELLDKIRNSDPYFFEQLVVDLLSRMGYSGEGGSAKVTSRSNDGGIDGIINQDPLGTSAVYLQAKRYKEDNRINRSDIQSFYGALASVRADRGVFITTSSYTSGAKEFAVNQGIVLIDGIQLTELMLKYKVGVEAENQYTIFRIDNDYFELNNI